MFTRRSDLRGVGVFSLSLLLLFSAVACAGPPRQQEPAGPPTPAAVIALTPVSVKLPGAAVAVLGAGFSPNKSVSLRLAGTWEVEGAKETNPSLITVSATNEFGAFKTSLPMPAAIKLLKIPAGVYTILAIQEGEIKASSPFEITQ